MISKVCTKNQWKTMENMNIHWSKSMPARTSPLGVGLFLNPFGSESLGVHPNSPPRIAMLAIPLEPSAPQVFVPWFLRDLFRSDGAMEVTSLIGRLSRVLKNNSIFMRTSTYACFAYSRHPQTTPLNEKNYRIASYNCWLRVVLVCSRVRLENS